MTRDQLRSACARTDGEIALIANSMRRNIITMLEAAGTGHPGGSLSAADIMATLYFSGVMGYDPYDPECADARPLRALQGPYRPGALCRARRGRVPARRGAR